MSDQFDDIVRRRMENTGESYATAAQFVLSAFSVIERDRREAPADWQKDWQTNDPVSREQLVEFVAEMSSKCRSGLRTHPPLSLVRGKVSFATLPIGTVGFIASYCEPNESGFMGSVSSHPDSLVRGFCKIDDLVVVGYRAGITPDVIEDVLRELEER